MCISLVFFIFCAISRCSQSRFFVYCRHSFHSPTALCSSQSTPEIELHANDLYFNNISFAFSRLFLLQLFKLNCNCFPLNAVVVALDVVVRLPRLFKLNSSGMKKKANLDKKNVRERKWQRIYNFSNISLALAAKRVSSFQVK